MAQSENSAPAPPPSCALTLSISPSTQSAAIRPSRTVKNAAPTQAIARPVGATPKNSPRWVPPNEAHARGRPIHRRDQVFDGAGVTAEGPVDRPHIGYEAVHAAFLRSEGTSEAKIRSEDCARRRLVRAVPHLFVEAPDQRLRIGGGHGVQTCAAIPSPAGSAPPSSRPSRRRMACTSGVA